MITYFTFYKPIFILELLISEYLFMCHLRRRSAFLLRFFLSMGTCILISAIPWHPKEPWSMAGVFLLLFVMTCVAYWCCYDIPFRSLLFCMLAGYNTQHFAHCVATGVQLLLNPGLSVFSLYSEELMATGDIPLNQLLSGLVLFVIVYFGYYACYHIFAARIKKGQTPILHNRSLLWVSVLSVVVSVMVNAFVVFSSTTSALALAINIYNAVCCLFILFMLFSLMDNQKMATELEQIHMLLQQSQTQYAQSKRNIELINIKCHDLKHQLRSIGKANQINESALQEMSEIINIYDSAVETGNPALDTILTEKSLYCYKNRINLKCMADGNLLSFMTEAEIYSLFGNALDNAIRAIRHVEDEDKRMIGLTVCQVHQFVTIRIYNYYETPLDFSESDLPLTTKADKEGHGLGLKSIRYIIEKYQGTMTISPDQGIFSLNIMIPLNSGSD